MIEVKDKAFNEIFLSEISQFDCSKYAYDTFFNCESSRFEKIAKEYRRQNGTSALNYMYKTFHSWKNHWVRPNGSSIYNIVASCAATFTIEEKFVEAYSQLAKYILHRFPKKIELKEINNTYYNIIKIINTFDLEKTTSYSKFIFTSEELQNYQRYVKNVFEFYTKVIFDNLNKDISLFINTWNDIDTSFLDLTFHTYLYNIEINIQNIPKKRFQIQKAFNLSHPISYLDIFNDKILDFSVERVTEIAKANNTVKLDAFLTEKEIEKIVIKKKEIEKLKAGGTLHYVLKTNSGILNIKLRILSIREKIMIFSRIIFFILSISLLSYYCLYELKSYLIFIVGLFASLLLVLPIKMEIINLFRDIFKQEKKWKIIANSKNLI